MKDNTNINEDHNAHHVYIHFSKIIENLLAVSRYSISIKDTIYILQNRYTRNVTTLFLLQKL